jgi:hypothetical protein
MELRIPSEILQGRLHQKPRRRSENNIKMDLIYTYVPIVAGQFEPLIPNGNPA